MPSLDSIVSAARQSVFQRRRVDDMRELEQVATRHLPRGFGQILRHRAQTGTAVIAELKKASPSKGLIRADFRPADLALELKEAGASALSVLTDEQFFQGSLGYLEQASAASGLPCLRKDFIVEEFQIVEARAHQADAILLIVAALQDSELTALAAKAREWQLDVLCEVHDENELGHALDSGFEIIGVNSRDLRTFEVDLATALRLAEKIPSHCLRIAESGIHTAADIRRLRSAGFDAFLIGESLMRAERPGEALKDLLHSDSAQAVPPDEKRSTNN